MKANNTLERRGEAPAAQRDRSPETTAAVGVASEVGGWRPSPPRKTRSSVWPKGGSRLITLKVELEREADGRWLAEVVELPGVLVYGETQEAPWHVFRRSP